MHREIAQALRDAYAIYTNDHAAETLYAFGLYVVSENGLIVGSCYATEEATARRAAEYEWMLGGTTSERAKILRWWDADWPYSNDLPRLFDSINKKLTGDPREHYLRALAELEVDILVGVFGTDRELTARSIATLNDADKVAQWKREVDEAERMYAR